MILLDVGASMATPLRERVPKSSRGSASGAKANRRFDAAVAAVEGIIQQKASPRGLKAPWMRMISINPTLTVVNWK